METELHAQKITGAHVPDGVFHSRIIAKLCQEYGLKSRYQRLCDRGMLIAQEIA